MGSYQFYQPSCEKDSSYSKQPAGFSGFFFPVGDLCSLYWHCKLPSLGWIFSTIFLKDSKFTRSLSGRLPDPLLQSYAPWFCKNLSLQISDFIRLKRWWVELSWKSLPRVITYHQSTTNILTKIHQKLCFPKKSPYCWRFRNPAPVNKPEDPIFHRFSKISQVISLGFLNPSTVPKPQIHVMSAPKFPPKHRPGPSPRWISTSRRFVVCLALWKKLRNKSLPSQNLSLVNGCWTGSPKRWDR